MLSSVKSASWSLNSEGFKIVMAFAAFIFSVILPLPGILVKYTSVPRKLLFLPWSEKADKPLDDPALWGVKGAINKPIGPLGCWFIPSTCRCATSTLCTCLCDTVVIYCHGSSGSRGNSHRVDLVNYLSSLGCAVYSFDYRGYADSPGEPSEISCVEDARRVVDFARAAHPNKRTVVHGHSLGTGVVAQVAYQLLLEGSPVDSVILEAPFLSIPDILLTFSVLRIVNKLPFYGNYVWNVRDKFPIKDIIEDLSNVLILVSKDDPIIPTFHSVELHKLCPDSTLHLTEHGGHDRLLQLDSVKKVIEKHLERNRPPPSPR